MPGRVVKWHRMPGHYVGAGEPVVDVEVAIHRLTLCAPFAGQIMRCREVGTVVNAGDVVTELTGVGMPTWELFVAYRRSDAPGHAGRIGDRLIGYFGPGQVFKDVESLPFGVDFVDFIRDMLQRSFVMVVIIGNNWVKDTRLQNPDDLHREEIRTALERGIRIVPAFVNGAPVPRSEDVPEDIRAVVRKQGVEITDTRWDYDVSRLIDTVAKALAGSPRRQRFLAQVPPWDYEGGVRTTDLLGYSGLRWSRDRILLDEPFIPTRRDASEVLQEDVGRLPARTRPLLPQDFKDACCSEPCVAQSTRHLTREPLVPGEVQTARFGCDVRP
jgi:hypothetical protein